MTLRDRRVLFTALKARLIVAIAERQWVYGHVEVAEDEGTVHSPRLCWSPDAQAGAPIKLYLRDAVHAGPPLDGTDSFHHQGLATDLLVYIDGKYIADGAHPIYQDIDAMARPLAPGFGLGLKFGDPNHLSLGETRA